MLWLLFLLLFVGCVGGECPGEDLSLAPRPYTKPEKLPVCSYPYRGPNCTCPSSMFECACHRFGRCELKPGCIPMNEVNDRGYDCSDWSDEFSDICSRKRFRCDCFNTTCKGVTGCLPSSTKCDGKIDCVDRSDEFNCTCPTNKFECACYQTKNCPYYQKGCVDKTSQCDEYNDCGDWSDELNCVCPANLFECGCYKKKNCTGGYGCVYKLFHCDGKNDCGDWSDEVNCTCPANKFECVCYKTKNCTYLEGGCIDKTLQCNGRNDCGDWSDEVNCTCPVNKFECACYQTKNCQKYDRGCINKTLQCNGRNDCGDWSDEVNCTCPADKFECACYKTINCTYYQIGCLDKTLQCDEGNDCGDWSDEVNCTCPAGKFECDCYKTHSCTGWYGGCVDKTSHCNGEFDCDDFSDELNCPSPPDLFECACYKTQNCTSSNKRRILRSFQCDGYDDCGDWSDELNCTCPADGFECDCYKTKSCTTDNGCINKYRQCDGFKNCEDWSDEINCTCPAEKFECACYKTKNCTWQGAKWIDKNFQCDAQDDCEDGSDENNCTCPADKFQCACVETKQCIGKERSCINRSLLCDGNRDCLDGSDETHYTCNCSGVYARCPCDPGDKHCPSTGKCIPFDWLGDNVEDCIDGSDEHCTSHNISCQSCTMHVTTCKSEKLTRYLVHSKVSAVCSTVLQPSCSDDSNSCKNKKHVCITPECKLSSEDCLVMFSCESQQFLPYTYFCDGLSNSVKGCNDNSDEIREGFGFKCSGPSRKGVCVLPQANVYDSVAQCSDKSDLCFVDGQFRCFQCLDKKNIISSKQVCDGIVDCFDMSDECLCPNQSLCDEIRGDCPPNQMHCYNSSECVAKNEILCNSNVHCDNQLNTKYCLVQNRPIECSQSSISVLRSDEKQKCASAFDKLSAAKHSGTYQRYVDWDHLRFEALVCDGNSGDPLRLFGEVGCSNTFYCHLPQEINIDIKRVCDGNVDCYDGSDEDLQLCKNRRYYCKSKDRFSIDRKIVCDGIIDCDNESDESRCRCEKRRFYCTNKQPLSIELKVVQNGILDCSDGSDECVNLAGDVFADVNEMISNAFYRVIFWITALLALGGNSFVFVATIHSLYYAKRDQNGFINTSIFILNLNISDFLMGVYLLIVIVQGTRFSGSYCLFDKEWRSSSLCSGLGALVVLSSEASALTMTAMTTFRLVSVFKPFAMRSVGVTKIIFAELFCWILSILLAIVPLLNATSEYFVTDVWFPNYFFGSDFVSRENMSLLAERITNVKPESWNEVKQIINKAFPRNTVHGEFGYYGETSVCMPRLFARTSEFAWEYSTFLITINFLMFIYMVIAYVLIYRQSNRMKGARSNDVSSKLQKRISRLIVTDFCCWIPICVMGYLSIGGIKMPPDAYVLSACLLLPINSALNPLLYSKVIEVQLTKARQWSVAKLSLLRTSMTRSSDISVRYNAGAEEEGDRVVEILG